MVEETRLTRDRWKTRRMMAWIAFWTLVGMVPISFLNPDSAQKVSGIIQLVAPSLAIIVMAYIGAATYDDVKGGKDV